MDAPSRPTRQELMHELQQKVVAAGIDHASFLSRLDDALVALPDPSRAVVNFVRFLESGFPTSLLRDFHSHPHLLNVFLDLVGQSQYLADILVRHPEWLRWLTATGELRRIKSLEELKAEVQQAIGAFEHPSRKRDALSRFHRREILRIGAQDILGEASMVQVTAQLSTLADVIVDEGVNAAVHSLEIPAGETIRHSLAVIGLGKLGGGELNFSSDIDLMFVYAEDGELAAPIGRANTTHELHIRLAELVVEYLTAISGDGYLYRVDMRLRPDGRSGPLALSRAGYMNYYETRGEPWERQMLLKARCVAGVRSVGDAFLADISPFVFRRTVLASPWKDIAAMKRAIEEEFHGEGNIKLGAGGIRDVEFLVQGLQLMHAGSNLSLRSSNTLGSIDGLERAGILPPGEAVELRESYELFRTVEHRLQLLHGFQTHELPEEQAEFAILSRKLGYPDDVSFRRELSRCREHVRAQFTAATEGRVSPDGDTPARSLELASMLGVDAGHPAVNNMLSELQSDQSTQQVYERLSALLSNQGTGAVYREAFASKRLCAEMIQAVGASQLIFERLASDPLLVESLVGQAGTLLRGRQVGWEDLLPDKPGQFKRYNELRSAFRFVTGRSRLEQFETELTQVADAVLRVACERGGVADSLLVVGAGRMGSSEMGVSSDLDLILVYDEKELGGDEAQLMGKNVRDLLASPEKSYDVDFRLRPEGRNAPLVAGISYLKEYMRERSEIWEQMAMRRSRPVWGTATMRAAFRAALRSAPMPTAGQLVLYVRAMRERMERERSGDDGVHLKVGTGGIVDIEFISQAGLLLQRRSGGRKTSAALQSLHRSGLLRKREVHLLQEGLTALRTVETLLRLNSHQTTSVLRGGSGLESVASRFPGFSDTDDLTVAVNSRMSMIRRTFNTILDRWSS